MRHHYRRALAAVLLATAGSFLQYLPANFTPTGIANTGTGGSAYDLHLPAGVPAAEVRVSAGGAGEPPAGMRYLRFPPGSYFRTSASLPARFGGQNPRTVSLLTRVGGASDGALCSYGVGQPGQASDVWVNGGAGGIFALHVYGASSSLSDRTVDAWVGLLARQQQLPDGWSVQNGHAPGPEPAISAPLVDTAATAFTLGAGVYGQRSYYQDVVLCELFDECLTDLQAGAYAQHMLDTYAITL